MSNRQSLLFALVLFIALIGIGVGIFLEPTAGPTMLSPPTTAAASQQDATAAVATGPAITNLFIKKATYGDLPDGASVDVTKIVVERVRGDKLVIAASNLNFGDPAPNIVKKLRVSYVYNDMPQTITVEENDTLILPSRLMITQALYGDLPGGGKNVVTQKVTDKVRNDMLTIEATNENFDDPAFGIGKQLRVEYTFDGQAKVKTAGENETLTISNTGE